MPESIDRIDAHILSELQRDAGQSQRELAEKVGLSQNACWRRIRLLKERGIIEGETIRLNEQALGRSLVVFTMIRTRNHSAEWLVKFRARVSAIPEVVDFYRLGGDYDYLLKIVTRDMASYDRVYQQLIAKLELETVTSYFAMEAIVRNRAIPL